MKFVSWNVNGLRAVVGKNFYDVFAELDADVFAVQETKLQEGQIALKVPEGLSQTWSYAERKGYSGTLVFSKRPPLQVVHSLDISADDIASARALDAELFEGRNFAAFERGEHYSDATAAAAALEADDLTLSDHEGRLCALEFPEFWFVTCYTPNSKDGLARICARLVWGAAFRRFVSGLAADKPVVICGDMNVAHEEIDLKNDKTNHGNAGFSDEERADFSRLLDAGFVDTFRTLHPDEETYSWWSYRNRAREHNAGWRIDYFLVSDSLRDVVREATIYTDILGSDHCPVGLTLDL